MTLALTLIDGRYEATGIKYKKLFFTGSLTNPYTAGGERITANTYFPNNFMGGAVTAIQPSVPIAVAGIVATGKFRADTDSVASSTALSPLLQFFNAGLSATSSAGLLVDNTVANLSGGTFTCYMEGN